MLKVCANEHDILGCRIEKWYEKFKSSTMKSILIEVPNVFIEYLECDGVIIPDSDIHDNLSDDDSLNTVSDSEVEEKLFERDEFKQFLFAIKTASKSFNNQTFIKFNWSSPSDAMWMNGNTLKCCNYQDILLLLKSSDRIQYDLHHSFDASPPPRTIFGKPTQSILTIKKWYNINPAMEFRLFIIHHQLIKICQRDCSSYYPFLAIEINQFKVLIYDFFNTKLKDKFHLSTYTVDIYITSSNKVMIIDFNPFGDPTNALLYEWTDFSTELQLLCHNFTNFSDNNNNNNNNDGEISKNDDSHIQDFYNIDNIEFKIINKSSEVLPSTQGMHKGPIDITLAPEFNQFMNICKSQQRQQQQQEQDLEDDDDDEGGGGET